jgi:hypothetical protein
MCDPGYAPAADPPSKGVDDEGMDEARPDRDAAKKPGPEACSAPARKQRG